MVNAFVLINVEPGSEENVMEQLKALNILEEAYISYGVYDIVIKVKADTMEKLKEAITTKIRTTPHVQATLTLIMINENELL